MTDFLSSSYAILILSVKTDIARNYRQREHIQRLFQDERGSYNYHHEKSARIEQAKLMTKAEMELIN